MKIKVYTHDLVTYQYAGNRKWTFTCTGNGYQFITACPGGSEVAHAVARQVNAGLRRTNRPFIDGLARKNIDILVNRD